MRTVSYQRRENIRVCQHIRGYSKTLFLDEMCALVSCRLNWKINNNAAVRFIMCEKWSHLSHLHGMNRNLYVIIKNDLYWKINLDN